MTEFVQLRLKIYRYLIDASSEEKKRKRTKSVS